jgi:hypothetical protein
VECSAHIGQYYSLVQDVTRVSNYIGQVSINDAGEYCQILTNNIPNEDFNYKGLKPLIFQQTFDFKIPKNPEFSEDITPLTTDSIAGVHLNGLIYMPIEPACYGIGGEPLGEEKSGCSGDDYVSYPWRYDPAVNPAHFGINTDWGRKLWHATDDGILHYTAHAMNFEDNYPCLSQLESEIIVTGFAADGFPIYGPCIGDGEGGVTRATSSYRRINVSKQLPRESLNGVPPPVAGNGIVISDWHDGTFRNDYEYVPGFGNLDECNGATVNGQYGYFFTAGYPYTVNCWKGEPDPSFSLKYQNNNVSAK